MRGGGSAGFVPRGGARAAHLWWPLVLQLQLLLLRGHAVSSKDVQPSCVTDFATALVCHWDVDTSINCTKEFRLRYSTDASQPSSECVPENESGPGAASTCACIIAGNKFESVKYHLVLERKPIWNRRNIWNTTVDPEEIVKPRPLVNLTVEQKRTSRSFVLTWKRDYKPENRLYNEDASHEVAYWPKGQKGKKQNFTVQALSYEIFADRLMPGANYIASVRYQLIWWGKAWSEWSTPCEWHNDFEPKPEDVLWKSVYWLCVPIVALILTCHLCFVRVKRGWWDRIPSPAKSKMVEATARAFPVVLKGDDRTAFCGPCKLGNYRKSQSKLAAALSSKTVREEVPQNISGVKPEVFLTPEVALVERPLLIYSRASAVRCATLDSRERGRVPREDPVASLFGDLLSGDWHTGDGGSQEPPAQGREPGCLLAALCLPPETSLDECSCRATSAGLETTSESGYRIASTEPAASPEPGSPPPEPWPEYGPSFLEAQPSVSPQKPADPLPGAAAHGRGCAQAEGCGSGGSTSTAGQPGYKCFSSLVSLPIAGSSGGWEHWLFPPQVDQILPQGSRARPCLDPRVSGPQPDFPGGQAARWLSSGRAAAAGLGFPPAPEATPPEKPGHISCPAASLSAGYRPFSTALRSSAAPQECCSLALESPYKPLLILRSNPTENPANLACLGSSLGTPAAGVWSSHVHLA